MTWKLQAITGEFTGQEILIDRDMLVGRHQDSDVLLQSSEISRKHAAFLLKNNSVHDKFHRTLILSGFCFLKIAKISLNSSFFPKPIKR